mmetsp:Transcript_9207/g.28024  ORF Transcript_9207/g.28024 Transcript_9207/m.28024 type:complete len:350 (-) Transcript_9207:1513-2562(-)
MLPAEFPLHCGYPVLRRCTCNNCCSHWSSADPFRARRACWPRPRGAASNACLLGRRAPLAPSDGTPPSTPSAPCTDIAPPASGQPASGTSASRTLPPRRALGPLPRGLGGRQLDRRYGLSTSSPSPGSWPATAPPRPRTPIPSDERMVCATADAAACTLVSDHVSSSQYGGGLSGSKPAAELGPAASPLPARSGCCCTSPPSRRRRGAVRRAAPAVPAALVLGTASRHACASSSDTPSASLSKSSLDSGGAAAAAAQATAAASGAVLSNSRDHSRVRQVDGSGGPWIARPLASSACATSAGLGWSFSPMRSTCRSRSRSAARLAAAAMTVAPPPPAELSASSPPRHERA